MGIEQQFFHIVNVMDRVQLTLLFVSYTAHIENHPQKIQEEQMASKARNTRNRLWISRAEENTTLSGTDRAIRQSVDPYRLIIEIELLPGSL